MGNAESDEEHTQQGGPVINYYYPQQPQQQQAVGNTVVKPLPRQRQERRAVGTSNVLEDTQAKIDMLHREIDHLDRIAAQRTRKAQQMYSEGNKKGALWEAAQVKELGKDKQAKMDNLKRIQSASRTHSNMREFADSQDIINRLTMDKQRMAVSLDIEAVHETDLDSRLVDRELDQALASIGITDEDRQEDEVENEAFLQTLLAQQPPPTVNQQQLQGNNMIYNGGGGGGNMGQQRRTNNNNSGSQRKVMSTVDSMLSL
jgi:hypothetical protein